MSKVFLSPRADALKPFLVMDVMAQAAALEREGRTIVHLEVGQPDFPAPPHVVAAAQAALQAGRGRYTSAVGLPELRQAIARRYRRHYGVDVSPDRILITAGTSPGLFLAFSSLLDQGDEVLLPDPGYACYGGSVEYLHGKAVPVPLSEADGYALDPERVAAALGPRTKALVINSPGNPTGMVLPLATLQRLAELPITVISDEIYHGLEYGAERAHSLLEVTDEAFVLDGCSKRYGMTGWRLGWMVVPERCVRGLTKVAQNYFISVAEMIQVAGVAALDGPEDALETNRLAYDRRRLLLVDGLRSLGFRVSRPPDGAFYVLADASPLTDDADALAHALLREAGVAVTPGRDFGARAARCLRFSYTVAEDALAEGIARMGRFLGARRA
jgi:aspartate/methionine/tyrosine aminotransferase